MASEARLTERLKKALPYCSNPHALPLHHRLSRCGDPDEWNGHFTCRTPGCDACRGRYIASQRHAALKRFADHPNTDLAFVSAVIGASAEVSDIGDIFQKFRKDVRNIIDARRRQRRSWRGIEPLMWLETDAFMNVTSILAASVTGGLLTGRREFLGTGRDGAHQTHTATGLARHPTLPW